MIIKEKIGNLASFNVGARSIDRVSIEWHEVNKRILHKRTQSGREVVLKFLKEPQNLTDDDLLWYDESIAVVVDIPFAEAICIKPTTMQETAAVCYEIGNKHLPLFYSNNELLIPFDAPLFKMLVAAGYSPKKEDRKLLNQLKTTVSPHTNLDNSKPSLFSKILQLTTTSSDGNY
jgi:urease accessory protein